MPPPSTREADVADTISFMRQSDFGQVLFASADPAAAARGWNPVTTTLAEHQAPDGVWMVPRGR